MGSEGCERDGTGEPARGREVLMPIAIEVPRAQTVGYFAIRAIRRRAVCPRLYSVVRERFVEGLLKTSTDKCRNLIERR